MLRKGVPAGKPATHQILERLTGKQLNLQTAVERAFLVAFLLTGSLEHAERAVFETINGHCWEDASVGNFLDLTAGTAVSTAKKEQPLKDDSSYRATLPQELNDVVDLPVQIRQSFVLRLLLGIPVRECESLLRVTAEEIANRVCKAAELLAPNVVDLRAFDGI